MWTASPPLEILRTPRGKHLRLNKFGGFPAIITSVPPSLSSSSSSSSSGGCVNPYPGYGWVAAQRQGVNGVWVPDPSGPSGTSDVNPAYEINKTKAIFLGGPLVGDTVWLYPGFFNPSCVGQEYLFDFCCTAVPKLTSSSSSSMSCSSSSSSSSISNACDLCQTTPATMKLTCVIGGASACCTGMNGVHNLQISSPLVPDLCAWARLSSGSPLIYLGLTPGVGPHAGTVKMNVQLGCTSLETAYQSFIPADGNGQIDCTATYTLPEIIGGFSCTYPLTVQIN